MYSYIFLVWLNVRVSEIRVDWRGFVEHMYTERRRHEGSVGVERTTVHCQMRLTHKKRTDSAKEQEKDTGRGWMPAEGGRE